MQQVKRAVLGVLTLAGFVGAGEAVGSDDSEWLAGPLFETTLSRELPLSDPIRGKELFVTKGCFICHAVRGAGGTVASSLDAPKDGRLVDPMVFAAGMWRGAQAMLTLQLLELGYQIDISADELRDLAAFASDPRAQADFSLEGISDFMRGWMIDKPYWLDDDWPERFRQRPEK